MDARCDCQPCLGTENRHKHQDWPLDHRGKWKSRIPDTPLLFFSPPIASRIVQKVYHVDGLENHASSSSLSSSALRTLGTLRDGAGGGGA